MGIYGFGKEKYWLDSLNMDRELNLPTLFSSALLLMAALLMQRLGQSNDRIAARDWRLLSKIFIFLALDEALQIHEILIIPGLRHQVHPALASTWVIPYTALALVMLWRFRGFLGSIPRATAARLLRSGAVYIGGAIGMEMVGSFAVRSSLIRLHSPWYGAITGLEEALELLGIILLIDALLRALLDQHNGIDLTLRLGANSDEN
ncbi:putative membrane protein [Synechococcus sp. PROS-U-1]|nr:putative membrane protein [Synechococcus sp. PROS-U-1]